MLEWFSHCMLGVVDREILHATTLISCSDEALSLVLANPMPEGFTFLVELVGIKVESFELAIEAKLCLEVSLRDARASIGEVTLEILEHFASWHLEVDVIACGVEVNFCPLIYALGHLLTQCAKHDIMHRWKNTALPLACPA